MFDWEIIKINKHDIFLDFIQKFILLQKMRQLRDFKLSYREIMYNNSCLYNHMATPLINESNIPNSRKYKKPKKCRCYNMFIDSIITILLKFKV